MRKAELVAGSSYGVILVSGRIICPSTNSQEECPPTNDQLSVGTQINMINHKMEGRKGGLKIFKIP